MSMMEASVSKVKNQTEKQWCTFRNILLFSICSVVLITVLGMIHNTIYEVTTMKNLNDMLSFRKYMFQNSSLRVLLMDTLDTAYITRTDNKKYNSTVITLCPEKPPNLTGPIKVNTSTPTYEEIEKRYPWVELGGRYRPSECTARQTVAIIIPYRNRDSHLRTLLNNLHPFLRKQQVHYGIYVINQEEGSTFNRAMLMNIGFKEALKMYNFSCFIFHDVDLLPEDDRNIYGCFGNPRHLAAAINKFNYGLPYGSYFGGATALSRSEYEKMNGCSNLFFGWGGEDDDMYNRVRRTKQKVVRYSMQIAKYKMIRHNRDKGNEPNGKRMQLIQKGHMTAAVNGLNSLVYKLNKIVIRKLYTWISVQIDETKVMKAVRNNM